MRGFRFPLLIVLSSLLFLSCGGNKQTFRMEGSFKGFNQGELYIYSVDGTHKLDTIGVANGMFRYETMLDNPTTLVIVFPNFSELPVVGENATEVTVEGDATHLKETKVSGTEENKLLTAFRLQTNEQTPPEVTKAAEQFIKDHPASPAARYLLRKHFIQTAEPNLRKAGELAAIICKAVPEDEQMAQLAQRVKEVEGLKENGKLPAFTAKDIDGKSVSSANLKAKANIITLWASWNYESMGIQRQLGILKERFNDDLQIVSFCLDASVKDCRKAVERDSLKWSNICDGRMWETPALRKLGFSYLPDNIVTDSKGKIVARGLNARELRSKVEVLINE